MRTVNYLSIVEAVSGHLPSRISMGWRECVGRCRAYFETFATHPYIGVFIGTTEVGVVTANHLMHKVRLCMESLHPPRMAVASHGRSTDRASPGPAPTEIDRQG